MLILNKTDLATTHPAIAAEVSPNSPLKATEVAAASTLKMLWRCELGHEWWATPAKRTNSTAPTNCPYCCNQKVLPGFNDLATTNPKMAKLISPNSPLKATEVTSGANRKMLWKCPNCENEWWATPWMVFKKRMKDNCPYCTNKAVKPGFNDLATTHPDVAAKVSPNSPIKATEVAGTSKKRLLWRCKLGHEWWATVGDRTRPDGATNCPYCSGRKVSPGFNDLATTHPEVAARFSPNSPLKATEVTSGANRLVLIRCEVCGCEWLVKVFSLTKKNPTGCPVCARRSIVSKGEKELRTFVISLVPKNMDVIFNDRSVMAPYEIDVYISALNLAFEYNGDYWHSDDSIRRNRKGFTSAKQYHEYKQKLASEHGVALFYVWESEWRGDPIKTRDFVKGEIEKRLQEIS